MKHLIDPMDLSREETDQIIAMAEDIIADRTAYQSLMAHRKLATLFYEPSTRTRLSFTSAMLELGGSVLGFADAKSSSVSKGETVQDTIRVVGCFADIIAMRHYIEGAPLAAAEVSRVPIINAGDGSHSHPTQTLTDLLTIKRELGHIDGITIGFCGDLRFGRTVHSLIKALSRYEGVKVVLIAPDALRLPDYIRQDVCDGMGIEYRETDSLDEAIPELDVLYMTRVQKERFLDEDEFDRVKDSFILDARRMSLAKKDMAVLHPLPRVNEILPEVDDDPRRQNGAHKLPAQMEGRPHPHHARGDGTHNRPHPALLQRQVHLQLRARAAPLQARHRRHRALLVLRLEGKVGRPVRKRPAPDNFIRYEMIWVPRFRATKSLSGNSRKNSEVGQRCPTSFW